MSLPESLEWAGGLSGTLWGKIGCSDCGKNHFQAREASAWVLGLQIPAILPLLLLVLCLLISDLNFH